MSLWGHKRDLTLAELGLVLHAVHTEETHLIRNGQVPNEKILRIDSEMEEFWQLLKNFRSGKCTRRFPGEICSVS